MTIPIHSIVAEVWDEYMRAAERLRDFFWYERPTLTYREELDRIRYNWQGDPIPRIAIVLRNLRALKAGNTMVWRGFNVKDRRQGGDRRRL